MAQRACDRLPIWRADLTSGRRNSVDLALKFDDPMQTRMSTAAHRRQRERNPVFGAVPN
jgi:hypothetical protein